MTTRSRFVIWCERLMHRLLRQKLYWVDYEIRDKHSNYLRQKGTISVFAKNSNWALKKAERKIKHDYFDIVNNVRFRFFLNNQFSYA